MFFGADFDNSFFNSKASACSVASFKFEPDLISKFWGIPNNVYRTILVDLNYSLFLRTETII